MTEKTMRQQRTRKKLLDLAMRVLAKNPDATLREIVEASDVGRATLFRHFKSRKQLIHELIADAEQSLEDATRPILEKGLDAKDTLEQLIRVLVPLGASFHFLNSVSVHADDTGIEDLYRNQLVRLKDFSRRLKSEQVVAADVPLPWLAAVLDNLIYTAWMTISDGDIAPNDAPGLVLKSFLNGLGH